MDLFCLTEANADLLFLHIKFWTFLFSYHQYACESRGLVALEPWGLTLPAEGPGKLNGLLCFLLLGLFP